MYVETAEETVLYITIIDWTSQAQTLVAVLFKGCIQRASEKRSMRVGNSE